ncbi:hypothetical protein PGT21_035802 [Puccinia graminis f. sp. tritici]|uniref:Uncharacterized protein n=1 Tax=Puccinia graminis f. sp. tritici TaxID=56615 RepID=A0A5B0R4E7_PUCGR|nr:hypothetical protein PGT21_035802 [Puccinia graminis f. sp. tritici]
MSKCASAWKKKGLDGGLGTSALRPSEDQRARTEGQKRPADPSLDHGSIHSFGSSKYKPKPKKKQQQKHQPASNLANTAKTSSQTKNPKVAKSSNETVQMDSNGEPYDYNQDSNSGSIEIPKKDGSKEDEFDHCLDYFDEPVWKKGDPLVTKLNFKCKWFHNTYRGQTLSNGNLKFHIDGSTQALENPNSFPKHECSKQAGVRLPASVAELRALEMLANEGGDANQTVLPFKSAFVNQVLNQMLMMWQIRQALPWSRIEDPLLRAAFLYSNAKALLFGRQWSANESKKLYWALKDNFFEKLHFNLIHDVWTTKGNLFAFIGAAVAYVNRKLTHIVNAGLAALSLKTLPPRKTKQDSESDYGNTDNKGSDFSDESEYCSNSNLAEDEPLTHGKQSHWKKHIKSTKILDLMTNNGGLLH